MNKTSSIFNQPLATIFLLCLIYPGFILAHPLPPAQGTTFDNATSLIDFHRSGGEGLGGAAWLDYDADGDLDLFVTGGFGSSNGLFFIFTF